MAHRADPVAAQRRRLSILLFTSLALVVIGLSGAGFGVWHLAAASSTAQQADASATEHSKLQADVDRLETEQAALREAADEADTAYLSAFGRLTQSAGATTAAEGTALIEAVDAARATQSQASKAYLETSRELASTKKRITSTAASLLKNTAEADDHQQAGTVGLVVGAPLAFAGLIAAIVFWLSRGKHDAQYSIAPGTPPLIT